MSKAEKNSSKLEILKMDVFPAGADHVHRSQRSLWNSGSSSFGRCFWHGFFVICSRGRMRVICEEIVSDISQTLDKMGHDEIFFEVKKFSPGFVIRVYLVRARNRAPLYKSDTRPT